MIAISVSFSSLAIARARTTPPMSGETTIGLSSSAAAYLPAGLGCRTRYRLAHRRSPDLFCVQVNGQHAVNADAGQKIRHHFCGDWHTSRTNTTVLTSITEVRDNGGDTTCRSTTQSINHNNQFHQVVIGGSTSGLDDENITTAYVFIDLYADFAVAKTTYSGVAKRSVQAVGNTLC